MFRKLDVAKLDQTKSSVARGIRGKIAEQFPQLEDEEVLDELIPKKCTMNIAKTDQKVNIVVVDGVPMFFQLRDGPYFPTLKLLHKYLPTACRSSASTRAPSSSCSGARTSCAWAHPRRRHARRRAGGHPRRHLRRGEEHALAVGITKMSTADIREKNKGVGVDTIHHLGDGLWMSDTID